MIRAFPTMNNYRPRAASVSDVVIRNFSGGLKITENSGSLQNRYATVLQNMSVNDDTSLSLRFGTKLFLDLKDADIVNAIEFNDRFVVVLSNGVIYTVTPNGSAKVIWNNAIANSLFGSPDGWRGGITNVDFVTFKRDLIITNGRDKPVTIDQDFKVTYLQDLLTGSNVNVPISSFIASSNQFVVMADVDETAILYISARSAAGTWPGDPEPNDATTFDLSTYVGTNSRRIRAIKSFRNYTIVFFETTMVVLQLGGYNEAGIHTPQVVDDFTNSGIINSRCAISTDRDLVFLNEQGIFSAARNVLGNSVESRPISDNLGDDFITDVVKLSEDVAGTFIVEIKAERRLWFFMNLVDSVKVYCLSYNEEMTRYRWSEITDVSFSGAFVSSDKRVYFFDGSKIYQQGNQIFDGEDYYQDLMDKSKQNGKPIPFVYESPWLDARDRMRTKRLINTIIETSGSAAFKFEVFVDDIYKDEDGNLDPALSLDLIGDDAAGFGKNNRAGFGGGRTSSNEQMYRMPTKFKKIKFRVSGNVIDKLAIESLGLVYSIGNYQR